MTGAVIAVPWPYRPLRVMDTALRQTGVPTVVATPVNAHRWLTIAARAPLTPRMRKRLEPWASIPHAKSVVGVRYIIAETAARPPLSRLPIMRRLKRTTDRQFDERVAALVMRKRPRLVITLAFHCDATLAAALAVGATRLVLVTDQYWTVAAALSDVPDDLLRRRELAIAARRIVSHGRILRNADYVLVQSQFVRQSLIEHGLDAAKIVPVYNGVDLAAFGAPIVPRPSGKRPLHVVSVAQLAHRKGLQDTVAGVVAAGDHVGRLSIAAGVVSPQARALRASLLGVPSVEILPPLDGAAMLALYQRADVFVLTSRADSGARAVYEALAGGLPVIVTRESGVGELITDGVDGFVVPARDPIAVANALVRLADDPDLRARIGVAARALAERHSWDAFAERFITELRSREPGLFRTRSGAG